MSEALPMLAEHQAYDRVDQTATPADYSPDEQELKLIKRVNALFEKAKKHRKPYEEYWLEYYQMFRGRQWLGEARPSYRHSEVINMIFQAIQSIVPILTDSKPRISFLPVEPSDIHLAEILNQLIDSDWTKYNWLMSLTEVIYDSHIFGAGMSSMLYDKESKEIKYESVDPFYCFPDPNATDVNVKAKSFIYAEPMDIDLIKCKWKEKGKFVKPDLQDLAKSDRTNLGEVRFISPTDQNLHLPGEGSYNPEQTNKALVITCYLKDDDYVDEEQPDLDDQGQPILNEYGSQQVSYIQKLKYPKGRKVVVCSNVVLEDEGNEYDDGKFPYQRLLNYILPREFWGISEVEQLKSPQKIFNKLVSFSLDVLTIMGNPIWVVDNDSGIDTDELYNRPGLVVEKNKGSEARREEGVSLQPYVLQLIDRMESWFNNVSGSQEVSRGVKPEGITAASAISQLQEAAQQRTRQKSRNMDAYLQSLGQQYRSRRFQFTDSPTVFRITNDQMAFKFFKFHVQDDPETGKKYAHVRNISIVDGAPKEDADSLKFEIQGELDVVGSTGSSLPFAKKERYEVAKEMFQLGVIDDEELLKAAEYPNWQQVKQRNDQKKAEQAALQGPPK